MKNMNRIIKSFGMTNQIIIADLLTIEKQYGIEGLVITNEEKSLEQDNYYLQFNEKIRNEAAMMAKHYELFYCLEKSIREMISDILEIAYGENWWEEKNVILEVIKQEVSKNMSRERDAGITPRSVDPIDYTTFGQLGEIIKSNWSIFGGVFNSVKAVEKVLFSLNSLRNPIAHCSPLAEDEVLRLQLSIKDWFRLSS
ncbi:Swt1 family HEPN domain-containing protein [Paenibacillus sp. FSL R7-0331]|uniref:Swt1 family HEPN domain-containing protein n=1 Tax=Paenibacillus sp. FSL R7-0331 TaxID=1536773 RepID=UPI0004F7683D|nr:Swt1 family HEPN domain-containing protein [Paenibacillus sp. FSL R7-0331]AIQ53410.1 hypothetical protein R70331_18960 [Paenibacillus sp. FSL R7-0331]